MERAGTLSRNNHAGRLRPTNPKRLLHSWVCTRFNRNKREDCPAHDESQRAGILHAPICGERRRAQAGAATLAASEIFAGSTAGQTSFWLKSRARSGASRWEVGKNGGALVSGRRQLSQFRKAIWLCAWRDYSAPRLRELGAKVSFVRNSNEPITAKRPDDFKELARKILIKNGVPQPRADVLDPNDPAKEQTIRWQSEILFYRYSEIRRRAALVNFKLHPDLVLCLHFNAEGWGDPNSPTLTDKNHLHLLVNGSYLAEELEFDDERFEMIRRLLSRAYDEELPLADTIAAAMARETGLPPYEYPTTNSTTKVGSSGYVYARNLLATRIYRCPVVYCEPYVMNSNDAFARIQAGDYEGTRNVNGTERKSIFREYADSVVDGLVDYYSKARPTTARSGGL